MVRKIKKYNNKKIRVRIDGRMHTMYFKSVMKAIKKSHKAYFAEDGHVELESLNFSRAGDRESEIKSFEQNPDTGAVNEPEADGTTEREPKADSPLPQGNQD